MKVFRKLLLLFMAGLIALSSFAQGNEYDVKAMFILNFIKYVEWPKENSKEIRVAIAGNSEIVPSLQALVKMKQASGNKTIKVFSIDETEVVDCEILFVPSGNSSSLQAIARAYAGKGVLIVTETQRNTSKGGAINLLTIDNKIRFEIYQSHARNAGIKISSRLNDLASNVYP